jgi:hypothetical protein
MTDDKRETAEKTPEEIKGLDHDYCEKHGQWYLSGGQCPRCRAEGQG